MIQSACYKIGLPAPTVVIGSADIQVLELLDIANTEGRELAKAGPWQVLMAQKTFTTVAQAVQTSAIPTDFGLFLNDTMFNRTTMRRIFGPISPEQWQQRQAFITASTIDTYFRRRDNDLLFTPDPTAGDTCAYEYIKKYWCESSGGTEAAAWAADTDVGILDENIMALGITFRYLKKKGLGTWQQSFAEYTDEKNKALSQDKGNPRLNMAPRPFGLVANVPEGNWP